MRIPNSIKNFLIVGSWAKTQITIENIGQKSSHRIFCYLENRNPGIISLVEGYKIGSLYEIDEILEYAKSIQPDLVLVTTASPLSLGLVDKLREVKIPVFGPTKKASKLECNKAFTRNLMKKYNINNIPTYEIFEKKEEAVKFAKKMNWKVAVKPIGLTEGLGVRVAGEQLKSKEEIIEYINKVLNKEIGSFSKVLIEEKIEGEEFTIQCLVHEGEIVSTPAVQDFKKLLPGDKGPNTASMGSYSTRDYILPFLRKKEYEFSLEIIKKTVEAFKKETGQECSGFLYGQFILTSKGIKLVEYNFRPGDPEWMNTLSVLKSNIGEVIINLMEGKEVNLNFVPEATVCKYIVPKNYPEKLNEILDVSFSRNRIRNTEVNYYYSCGKDEKSGKLNVGEERGIAFLGRGKTVPEANKKVEKAISYIKGDFRYRDDIGTVEMMNSKKKKVAEEIR